MDFFISSAFAQAADASPQQPSPIYNFVFLGGFILIFYFLIWRPQSKRAKEHRSLLENLGVGDEIMTTGGMLGRVNRLDDHYVALQVADNVELKVQKSSVAAVLPKGTIKNI